MSENQLKQSNCNKACLLGVWKTATAFCISSKYMYFLEAVFRHDFSPVLALYCRWAVCFSLALLCFRRHLDAVKNKRPAAGLVIYGATAIVMISSPGGKARIIGLLPAPDGSAGVGCLIKMVGKSQMIVRSHKTDGAECKTWTRVVEER